MEFERVLKKASRNSRSIKKEVDFLGVIKKMSFVFSIGLGFLVLEFLRGVAQISGISRGKSLFSNGKVAKYKFQGFLQMCMYIINPPLLWISPGIAQYS